MVKFYLFLMLGFVPVMSTGANANCDNVKSIPEQLICSDSKLDKLNQALLDHVATYLSQIAEAQKGEFQDEQNRWLKTRDKYCVQASLCRQIYLARLDEVKNRIRSIYYLNLLNDGDWLTGVWRFEAAPDKSLYALYERIDGEYLVRYWSLTTTVNWQIGKIVRYEDFVLEWDYEFQNGNLELTTDPTRKLTLSLTKNIEASQNKATLSLSKSIQSYYSKMIQINDPDNLKWIAKFSNFK